MTPPAVMGCPERTLAALVLAAAVAVAACGGDGDEGPAGEDADVVFLGALVDDLR